MRIDVRTGLLMLLVLAQGCPPVESPQISLSVPGFVSNMDAVGGAVTVSVDGPGGPGQGTVTLTTTLGELSATTLTLEDGVAKATIRCVVGVQGPCVGTAQLTATWSGGGEPATGSVRFGVSPARPDASVDAGDGGSPDGGLDGGDGGASDGGSSGPAFSEVYGAVIVLGPVGQVGPFGFAALETPERVTLGFSSHLRPVTPAILGSRLLYIRDHKVYEWRPDPLVPPGGFVDAGADGGSDAGQRDAGALDGSFTFPVAPEANDIEIASGCFMGAERLISEGPRVWVQCLPELSGDVPVRDMQGIEVPFNLRRFEQVVMISGPAALVRVTLDAGTDDAGAGLDAGINEVDGGPLYDDALFALQGNRYERVRASENRRFGTPRASASGFEVVSFDPLRSRCFRTTVSPGGVMVERAAPDLPPDGGCALGRFLPNSDDVLIPGLAPDGGRYFFVYQPPPSMRDAGADPACVPDAGDAGDVDDAGVDGGTDAGVDGDGGTDAGLDGGADGGSRNGLDGGFPVGVGRTNLRARPPAVFIEPDSTQEPLELLIAEPVREAPPCPR